MNKNFEQMLRLVDYVDGLMVVDKNCIIRHYYTAYPDLVNLRQDEPLNRSLFEIYPTLKREDSYICRALKTGESFINYEQTYINYKGDAMEANCSAVPIKEHGEVVGVIDMVIYKDAHVTERRLSFDISLISALTKSYNTSDQSLEDIVTQDGEMIRIKEKILQTADSDAHVLVYGKTGTGKELIVNAIQKTSRRKDAPFIKQNCASIPSTLLESILFGTTKGSYTGAKDTPGLFELADGGTLFLDEIGELPLLLQAKLLRALQQGEVQRVGSDTPIIVDVRVIAATNKNLEEAIAAGTFREDLYYRLRVVPLHLPPLRERGGDLDLLLAAFTERLCRVHACKAPVYAPETMERLRRYPWPGNVRELRNFAERMVILFGGKTVLPVDLPPEMTPQGKPEPSAEAASAACEPAFLPQSAVLGPDLDFKKARAVFEARYLEAKLHECGGNITRLAETIGLERSYLHRKLKGYGISSE